MSMASASQQPKKINEKTNTCLHTRRALHARQHSPADDDVKAMNPLSFLSTISLAKCCVIFIGAVALHSKFAKLRGVGDVDGGSRVKCG
jgi:hypothetical protein